MKYRLSMSSWRIPGPKQKGLRRYINFIKITEGSLVQHIRKRTLLHLGGLFIKALTQQCHLILKIWKLAVIRHSGYYPVGISHLDRDLFWTDIENNKWIFIFCTMKTHYVPLWILWWYQNNNKCLDTLVNSNKLYHQVDHKKQLLIKLFSCVLCRLVEQVRATRRCRGTAVWCTHFACLSLSTWDCRIFSLG